MDRGQLEQAFRWKITAEMRPFKERVLQKEKEEIFALAYRIDCTIRIYEILLECCGRMGKAELGECICVGSLLGTLYEGWLKEPDSQEEEMEHSLCSIIKHITEGFGKTWETGKTGKGGMKDEETDGDHKPPT